MSSETNDGARPDLVDIPERHQELYQKWGEHMKHATDKPTTRDKRRKGVRYWLAYAAEQDIDPMEADTDDLESYIQHLQDSGAGDNTVSTRISSISVFYEWVSRNSDIDADPDNPRSGIQLEKKFNIKQNRSSSKVARILKAEDRENRIVLSDDVIDRMVEHAPEPSDRNSLIIRLMADTGVRPDEMARMKTKNVDWQNRRIRVRSSKLNDDDHPDLYRRYVFYTKETESMLEEWVNKGRHRVSSASTTSPFLFLTDQSEKMRPSHISRKIKEAATNSGDNEVLYQDANGNDRHLITARRLRHTAISKWVNDMPEVGLADAQRMAGHAKLETTQGYTHTSWDGVQRAFRAAHGER